MARTGGIREDARAAAARRQRAGRAQAGLVAAATVALASSGAAGAGAAEEPPDELAAPLRGIVVRAAKAGGPPKVFVEVFGRSERVDLVRADERGMVVRTRSVEAPVPWTGLKPARLASIASKLAKTGADHVAVARYCSALGLADEAGEACRKAVAADPGAAADADAVMRELREAEARRAEAAAEAARVRREAADAARAERERLARMRLNHEGRELPPLPKLTEPVLCNTPEADRILSSMQIFPKNSHWNTDISKLPVLPNSDELATNLARGANARPGTEFTFIIVPPGQPRVEVQFDPYPGECDREPYPLPETTPIEGWADPATGTGDRHAAAVDPVNMKLYELYQAFKTPTGWKAFGCIFDLASNKLRRKGWTSSDAAGLPIFPALARYDECERGMVEHAMRVCVPTTRFECIYPATHATRTGTSPDLPAMGQRFRLKADVDISGLSKHAKAVALGLKKYGMFVADNGDECAICAVADARLKLRDLRKLRKTDFEAVDTSSLPIPADGR